MIKKTVQYIRIPKKPFFIILGIVGLTVAAWSLRPQSTPVDLGLVSQGVFTHEVKDEGVTHFRERQLVSAPADGITPTIEIEAGDPVKKGQVLFKFLWDRDFPIRSPLDGVVLQVFEKDRRHVARGTPLIEIGNPASIELISKFLSEEVLKIRAGQHVRVENWGGDQTLDAEIVKIESAAQEVVSALGVKEQRVKVHMNFTSDPKVWSGLGHGFRVDVNVITRKNPQARLIPVSALFSNQGHSAVFVYRDGHIEIVPIEIEGRNQEFAELKTDLPIGTQVVLYPGAGLRAGDRVRPRKKQN